MRYTLLAPLASLVVLVACADTATAPRLDPPGDANLSSVHLKGGKRAEPAFADLGLRLNGSSDLSGLGNYDTYIGLAATANAVAICRNPGSGDHQPPGQNPAPVQVTGGAAIPASEIDNGNLHFSVTTEVPASAGPRPATKQECPGVNWEYEIVDLSFTTGTITVQQPQNVANPSANIVLTVACSFAPATSNGPVAAGHVSCTVP